MTLDNKMNGAILNKSLVAAELLSPPGEMLRPDQNVKPVI